MRRQPPRSTRTDTPFPSPPLFRSQSGPLRAAGHRATRVPEVPPAGRQIVRARPALPPFDRAPGNPATVSVPYSPEAEPLPVLPMEPRFCRRASSLAPSLAAAATLPAFAVRSSALSLPRSEEHTSELQSLMPLSYAVFFFKKKTH